MSLDFNNAPEQRSMDLIPDGTVCNVSLLVRPGSASDGGWLKRSQAGDSEALDCEFVVLDGKYAKRKFWALLTVIGVTEGHGKAAEISGAKIRAMLESARGIRPDDQSPTAAAGRRISGYGDLDGLRFVTRVSVEAGKVNPKTNEKYKDRNTLGEIITPDKKDWTPVQQVITTAAVAVAHAAATSNGKVVSKPAWAS